MNNEFQIHDLYVYQGLRIIEYTTTHGIRRFDIQPWKGERTLRIPIENSPGNWQMKEYPIEFYADSIRQTHPNLDTN